MIFLFAFIPFLAAYILPHDKKQIDSQDNCAFGEGVYGKVCSFTIDSHEFVLKTPKYKNFEEQEMASLLYTASRSTPFVIRPTLVSFSAKGFELGMPKMVGSLFSAMPPHFGLDLNPQLKRVTTEQTLIDVIYGIAELRKIGIAHTDVHRGNVVLDALGHVYIIDFGLSRFMPVETREKNSKCELVRNFDNPQFMGHFKEPFMNFFKDNNIKLENDWQLIFRLLDLRNLAVKTFGWVAEQIKNNYFKLNK